jgi:tetratricopeptide (TPR) repeat protein
LDDEARGFVPNSLVTLADAYAEHRNDLDRALAIIHEALRKSPRFANAHFMLGRLLAKAGRGDEAIAAYQACIDDAAYAAQQFVVDDELYVWKAHCEIGNVHVNAGRFAEALEWFDRGLRNRPTAQPLLANRAKVLEALGRYDDAAAAYRELYERFHDDFAIGRYVNYLLRRGENQRALATVEDAASRVGDVPTAVSLLTTGAGVAAQLCDGEAEERLLQRARALAPGSAAVLAALEALYRRRGDGDALSRLYVDELTAPCTEAVDFARRSSRCHKIRIFEVENRSHDVGDLSVTVERR